ncbi:DUF4129 domain-containing transglutaminase family protein [Cohnella faecalis]|uniref:DUF4129 domain-containing protein n=1 Tax=Cohnella faecalis TaxID=2315694 RepID=A0A398CNG9_9BACL|nr:transglutaminase domain-containing protein [Cohnella faecalis]RIE04153.1 DUF4129 domain-containing protein [Cohnella faecalis]
MKTATASPQGLPSLRSLKEASFWHQLILERLHRLFAAIIVLQLVQCFGSFWWEETYSIIYGTVTVTILLELLSSRGYYWKFAVQVIFAALFTLAFAPYFHWDGWPDNWHSIEQLRHLIVFHARQLHPFIEIAAGVVLCIRLLSWIGGSRPGVVAVIVGSLGSMAIADSFFPLELWTNIAWIVVAGLGWLFVLHLKQLRSRHPDSWEALAERPFELFVPAILIISLLMISGIFLPRAPVILKDPYTMWTEAQGKEVPAFAGEGGVVKVESSTKSGSSQSGYGRDDRTIGGGFDFDYSPVMTVTTTRKSYWRGETKAVYTGKGWSDRKDPEVIPYVSGSKQVLSLAGERSKEAKTEQIVQTFTFQRKDKIPVLFAAGPLAQLQDIKSSDNVALKWNPNEWELRFNKASRTESYTVVSNVPVLDEDLLRLTPDVADGGASIDIAPYLQLTDKIPQRVKDLAVQVTSEAQATNSYDKAKALAAYLQVTYPYNNKPDISKRQSEDVVDAFLFEIKEGYCDYYSTSFVVMARSLGIPARWVKGYATGFDPANNERMRFGAPPDPLGAGTYTVRNADAHSWAEVYFEGYGWIPFEPTSGFTVPQALPEGKSLEPVIDSLPATESDADESNNESFGWLLPAGGAAGLLLVVSVILWRVRNRNFSLLWNRIRYSGTSPNGRIVREMEKLLRFMSRRGMRREPHETLRETFARWGSKFGSLRADFDGVLQQFERARYGGEGGDASAVAEFSAAAEKIRKAL